MFRKNTKLKLEHVNFLFDWGGVGDMVGNMPAIKYVLDNYPHVVPHVWVPDYFLDFAKHLLNGSKAIITPFSKQSDFNQKLWGKRTSNDHHTNMKSHLVDNAFHILIDKVVDIEFKNYLQINPNKIDISKFNLPEKYVVVTTGFTAEVREMSPTITNDIIDYIKSKGYEVVFLGKKVSIVGAREIGNIIGNFKTEIEFNKGIDLIDKTTLLEASKVIANAKVIVGLDNGLLHIAGCSDVAIVGGFTTVEPKYRMAYRRNELGWNYYPVIPDTSLACRFCQSNWEFIDNNFTKCYYKEKGFDKTIQCVDNLKAIKYIIELEKIL